MRPLTDTTPKPLLKAAGKTLLEHKLDILPAEIDEVILIVGYLGQQIVDFFGSTYKGKKLSYVWQEKVEGTGKAVALAKQYVQDGPFLVLMGDDIYDKEDLQNIIQHPWAVMVKEIDANERGDIRGGLVFLDEQSHLKEVREGIHHQAKGLLNIGAYVLSPEFFSYPFVKLEGREEYGLPQTLVLAAKDHPISILVSKNWISITTPQDLDTYKL